MLRPVYRPKLTGVEKTEWSSLPGKKKKREKQRTNICGIPTIKVEDEDYILKHLEQFLVLYTYQFNKYNIRKILWHYLTTHTHAH